MQLNVTVSDEVRRRLEAAAETRGVTAEELAGELLDEHTPGGGAELRRRHLSFAAIGERKHGIAGRVDELLADGFGL